jgi:hypothetical protein
MPKPVNVMGRVSSITNSFINAIIPVVPPSREEVLEALKILRIDPSDLRCAYCGDPFTEWDHLRPLVYRQRPTGYISEIANLVPACGKCNQSKGNKPWRDWIESSAKKSPKSRGVTDLDTRIERLAAYENWRNVEPLDFAGIVGVENWSQHWENWQRVLDEMQKSQEFAAALRATIRDWYNARDTWRKLTKDS